MLLLLAWIWIMLSLTFCLHVLCSPPPPLQIKIMEYLLSSLKLKQTVKVDTALRRCWIPSYVSWCTISWQHETSSHSLPSCNMTQDRTSAVDVHVLPCRPMTQLPAGDEGEAEAMQWGCITCCCWGRMGGGCSPMLRSFSKTPLPRWALAAYLLSSAAQELICLSKFCLFILARAEMIVICAEGSGVCVGNPSSCEKLGIDNYSENWNDLCGLEDGLSYKIMFPIK